MKYKIISLALAAIAALPLTAVPASAAGLGYSFTGDEAAKAGYAEGKINLSGFSEGTHYLYWADNERALDGYYELAEVEVKGGKGEFTMGDHSAIPPEATKLIAVNSKSDLSVRNAEAVFTIPEAKRFPHSKDEKNYSFMNYSDIHIDCAKHPYYEHSELHFQKALETAAKRKADFIVTAGDNITNAEGPAKEFDKYQQILADSPYTKPIYECSGNHELRVGDADRLLRQFASATGLDGKPETLKKGKPYYYVEEKITGDIFIFMSLEFEYSPNEGEEFSDEQLDWFENVLKKYYGKGRNVFLVQHALVGGGYGAGDDEDNFYTVPLNPVFESTKRFVEIIESHPDLIWMSGHTHIALSYGYNYSDMDGSSCHMIHDSSVCCPTKLDYTAHKLTYEASSGDEYKDFTEGYYVEVYDDAAIYYGENLYHDKIYPSAAYIVESCRESARANKAAKQSEPTDNTALTCYAERVFTLPKSFDCKSITESDLTSLKNRSAKLLNQLYTLSSFDAYQALKDSLRAAEKSDNTETSYKKLVNAYLGFLPYTRNGKITVYFTDTAGWGKAYAKLSSLKGDNGEKGEKMTFAEKDGEGNDVYKITLNCREYNSAQFTDGTAENVSEIQYLGTEDNKLFYLNNKDPLAPFTCFVRTYEG